MNAILPAPAEFELQFQVLIVGGGGTALSAALAASDAGAEVLVLERDGTPSGSTAMSTGLIPAAGTPEQAAEGIDDSPERFLADIMAKTKNDTPADYARTLATESPDTVAWLRDVHGVPLSLAKGWLYPGHSAMRMYGTPSRSGAELMAALDRAVANTNTTVLTNATVIALFADGGTIAGVRALRPNGEILDVGCDAVVLACSGFGGNAALVERYIPEMAGAVYHGHPGNKGDALTWGEELGAAVADMAAYQGHGGLAVGYGVPILWPLIMEGGIQVNARGLRFSNEAAGYSEQAAKVNAQPGQVAWSIFDERLHTLMVNFADYRDAVRAGAVVEASSIADLADRTRISADALAGTMQDVAAMNAGEQTDLFGRDFTGQPPLQPPYRAAKVTGALFHTQGGLVVDRNARVLKRDGTPLPNLFAGGGAARGISGSGADGYLAGNGLLTATTLGRLAGREAATLAHSSSKSTTA
jgi:fumarate reductase flavoprotein subunit